MSKPSRPDNKPVAINLRNKLPPAPIRRRVDYGPVTRVTVSMTQQEKEKMRTLAEQKKMKVSQLVRLSLENQHFLESVVRNGGRITIETNEGTYEFDPMR